MRIGVALVIAVLAGCGTDPAHDPPFDGATRTLAFGPFDIEAEQEISDQCIQITLDNADTLYVNKVELTTGPGFHHSNWFFVPENTFIGPDGTWTCDDRFYSEPRAAQDGGVLFAQSTQAPHETQAFPENVALKIPPHSKIVAQIHLLNTGDEPVHLEPNIKITPIETATTLMAGVSFENQALLIHANKKAKFTLDCDIAERHQQVLGRAPDFKLYYGLAHYHHLGTKLTIDAVRADETSATVFTTEGRAGDVLGGPIDPLFDFTGFSRLRFTCEFQNTTGSDVIWGIGNQEMCVFLAFSDSSYQWGGGATSSEQPAPDSVAPDGTELFTHDCDVFGIDATR